MEDIEVGEYVRIDNDFRLIALGIGKVISVNKDTIYVKMNFELPFTFKIENITKHSKNIIDLIEAGDIVVSEGMKFEVLENFCKDINTETLGIRYYNQFTMIEEIPIESIATKEQYDQNCYRLEEQ